MNRYAKVAVASLMIAVGVSACGAGVHDRANRAPSRASVDVAPPALLVCDQRYWAGSEGNHAIAVIAKFRTEGQLIRTLSISQPIGSFDGETWTLADVLLDLEMNANGNVANWRVSGPAPLVESYERALRDRVRTDDIYDLFIQPLEVVTIGHLEGDEG